MNVGTLMVTEFGLDAVRPSLDLGLIFGPDYDS